MDFDPHTLHQILQKIKQQLRCPQCGERVPVDFASVRLTGDDFVLLQLKCEVCDAYIVLHASLQVGTKPASGTRVEGHKGQNASSALCMTESEMETLRAAIDKADGSFKTLFDLSKPE